MNIQKVRTLEMTDTMTGHIITDFNTQVTDPDANVASYGLTKGINDNLNRFIDVTKELNTYNNSFSHTATEDCYVGIQFFSENNILNEEIKIDNKRISQRAITTGSNMYFYDTFFVKKDHTISCVMVRGTSQATVYGCI